MTSSGASTGGPTGLIAHLPERACIFFQFEHPAWATEPQAVTVTADSERVHVSGASRGDDPRRKRRIQKQQVCRVPWCNPLLRLLAGRHGHDRPAFAVNDPQVHRAGWTVDPGLAFACLQVHLVEL